MKTYPELRRGNGGLSCFKGEVKSFLWCLASAKAAAVTGGCLEVHELRGTDVGVACSSVRQPKVFASSLVEVRGSRNCWPSVRLVRFIGIAVKGTDDNGPLCDLTIGSVRWSELWPHNCSRWWDCTKLMRASATHVPHKVPSPLPTLWLSDPFCQCFPCTGQTMVHSTLHFL